MTKREIKALRQEVFLIAQDRLQHRTDFACHALNLAANGTIIHECAESDYFRAVLRPRRASEATTLGRYDGMFYWNTGQSYGTVNRSNKIARGIGLALVAILAKEGFVP